ncbi:lysophospholipid acyltransferase family protein [Saccharospirillum impatiens]|uniref:lysophospholipid acyltransferase family protein n=1 Tax=Saccharospirillum impatiens TaxID=169438 RepID=UPI000685A3D1|nr:lysophospholipid acyltransferase family protein [Saccharospirillum impatiens]
MRLLRRLVRLLGLVGALILGIFLILGHDLGRRLGWLDRHSKHLLAQWWYSRLLRVMRVEVSLLQAPDQARGLIAANHISWLDIPVLGSVLPTYFLAKIEVGQIPVIGWLARRGGTLFIHRGKSQHAEVLTLMQALMRQGGGDRYLTFFPEATTGPGDRLRPFHPRLFAAAIETALPVVPVAIRYSSDDPNHPIIPYGEESMASNIMRVLGEKQITVEVSALPALASEACSRRQLADQARLAIALSLRIPATPLPGARSNRSAAAPEP